MVKSLFRYLEDNKMYTLANIFDFIQEQYYSSSDNIVLWFGFTIDEVREFVKGDLNRTASFQKKYRASKIKVQNLGKSIDYIMNKYYVLSLHVHIKRHLELRTKKYYTIKEFCDFLEHPPNIEHYYHYLDIPYVKYSESDIRKKVSADFNGIKEFEKRCDYGEWCVLGPVNTNGGYSVEHKDQSGRRFVEERPSKYPLKAGKPDYLMNRSYAINLRNELERRKFKPTPSKSNSSKTENEIKENIQKLSDAELAEFINTFYQNIKDGVEQSQVSEFRNDKKHRDKLSDLIKYIEETAPSLGLSFSEPIDDLKDQLAKISKPWGGELSAKTRNNAIEKVSASDQIGKNREYIAQTLYKFQNKTKKDFEQYYRSKCCEIGDAFRLWIKYSKLVMHKIDAVEDEDQRFWLKECLPDPPCTSQLRPHTPCYEALRKTLLEKYKDSTADRAILRDKLYNAIENKPPNQNTSIFVYGILAHEMMQLVEDVNSTIEYFNRSQREELRRFKNMCALLKRPSVEPYMQGLEIIKALRSKSSDFERETPSINCVRNLQDIEVGITNTYDSGFANCEPGIEKAVDVYLEQQKKILCRWLELDKQWTNSSINASSLRHEFMEIVKAKIDAIDDYETKKSVKHFTNDIIKW